MVVIAEIHILVKVLCGFIETFVILSFILSVARIQTRLPEKFTITLSILMALISLKTFLDNIFINNILGFLIINLAIWVFTGRKNIKIALSIIVCQLIINLVDSFSFMILPRYINNDLMQWIITGILHIVVIYLATLAVPKVTKPRKHVDTKRIRHFRNATTVVSTVLVAFMLISIWHAHLYLTGVKEFMGIKVLNIGDMSISFLSGIASIIISIIYLTSHLLLKITNLEHNLALAKLSNESAQNTIKILRVQRHDFLNHFQVVIGYLQLNKQQDAIRYIKTINTDLKDIRAISGLSLPDVAVLLLMKKEEALRHGIKVKFDINTDLANIKISQFDMVRVVANLVDNALHELERINDNNCFVKTITITINKIADAVSIDVHNSPCTIKDETKIFDYGYSTKESEDSGLYLVKRLVERKYGGIITVNSNELETVFSIAV